MDKYIVKINGKVIHKGTSRKEAHRMFRRNFRNGAKFLTIPVNR